MDDLDKYIPDIKLLYEICIETFENMLSTFTDKYIDDDQVKVITTLHHIFVNTFKTFPSTFPENQNKKRGRKKKKEITYGQTKRGMTTQGVTMLKNSTETIEFIVITDPIPLFDEEC